MIAYEFYQRDPVRGDKLVGVLPERRRNPERSTQESIMRWGENIFGNDVNFKDLYFIKVTKNEQKRNIFRAIQFFITRQKEKKKNMMFGGQRQG